MAAAAANSEILEDISKVLQMLEEEITKIHKLCLLRRREIDCCIQQCRPLLKPWPLKSDKSEETTENTAKSSMIHQSESTVVQGTEITDNEAKEAERQDLAALDGLLAKAQKAREIQTKIDEAAAKANQKKVSSKKPIPVTTAHAKESPLHATKESLSSKPSKPAASKKPSAAGKSAAQRQVLKSTYSSSYGRRPSSAKSLIRPAKSQSSTNVYLDSVIGRNAKERKQTINDSKQQGSIASSSKRNLTPAGGVNVDSKRHDTVVSLPEVKDGSSSATRLLNAQACNAQSIEIRHCHGLDVPDDNVHSSSLTERDHQPGSVTGKSPESVSALRKGDCLPNSDQADKQEMFDPFGEGVELKLPIKYRRLKATTVKLYSELENFSEKRESHMPSQQFVQGIESLFDMGDIPTHSELQEKGIALLKEHEKLSILTSNVVNRSENLGDDSPWPEVYKCYRLWQIVLNKFNELQKGTQQLLEAEERLSKVCPCGKCSFFDREYLWDDSSCQIGGKGQEGCVLLASWLSEEIQDISSRQNISRRRGTTEFTYSSPRELSELIRLHHETQVLCMQFHIKKLAGEKLLPILEKLEPSDSAFVPLYRMIHGFLCGDCKVFPAVVLDNV